MSWLAAIFLGRSVDMSLAKQTADLKGRPPKSVSGIAGLVTGVLVVVGTGFLLQLLGVEEVSLLVALAVLAAAVFIGAVVSEAVKQTLGS